MKRFFAVLACVALAGAFAVADEPPVQTIEGRVVDAEDTPLASVKVSLFDITMRMTHVIVTLADETESDENGAFSFSRSLPEETGELLASVVLAERPGLAIDWYTFSSEDPTECMLVLGEPFVFAGRVMDEEGRPVAGAEVGALMEKESAGRDHFIIGIDDLESLRTTTGPDGLFSFENIPAGARAGFVVTSPGMARTTTLQLSMYPPFTSRAGDTDIEIRLSTEAVIEGVVVERETGRGVEDVCIIAMGDERAGEINPFESQITTSGEDGAFRVDGLKGGRWDLRLPAPAGIAEWVAEVVSVEAGTGETVSDVKLELDRGGLLEVIAMDETSGSPAEGLRIILQGADGQQSVIITDSQGKAVVRLAAGEGMLQSSFGRLYHHQTIDEVFEIRRGETTSVQVVIRGPMEISGVILDEEGLPVEGADVTVKPSFMSDRDVTGADGAFTLRFSPYYPFDDGHMRCYIVARHQARNLASVTAIHDTDGPLEVTLRPGAVLSGSVRGPDGEGIRGAAIHLSLRAGELWSSFDTTARTDARGRYRIDAVPTGTDYQIIVTASGYGQSHQRGYIHESDDLAVVLEEISLKVADQTASGRVVDEAGNPVAGARVNVQGEGQPHVTGSTDESGYFRLEGLVEGYIQVLAWVGQDNSGWVYARAGDEDIEIVARGPRSAPAPAVSLVGRALGNLADLADDPAPLAGRPVVICFFDAAQRPSRHVVAELAARAGTLSEKGVGVLAVDASGAALQEVRSLLGDIDIPLGSAGDAPSQVMTQWGVQTLPWLILADDEHVVHADGVAIAEIEVIVDEMLGR